MSPSECSYDSSVELKKRGCFRGLLKTLLVSDVCYSLCRNQISGLPSLEGGRTAERGVSYTVSWQIQLNSSYFGLDRHSHT